MTTQQSLRRQSAAGQTVSLAGTWSLQLDEAYLGEMERWWLRDLGGDRAISLPATLDTAGIGFPPGAPARGRPARKVEYGGCAWYQTQIEIPQEWAGREITFLMERCSRISKVWLDDQYLGSRDSVSTPHRYTLPENVTPGAHRLTVEVDNTYAWIFCTGVFIGKWASCICDDLQTNWNGILGEITLSAAESASVRSCVVTPRVAAKTVELAIDIACPGDRSGSTVLNVSIRQNGKTLCAESLLLTGNEDTQSLSVSLPMPEEAVCWDPDNPALCEAVLQVIRGGEEIASYSAPFGYREFKADGTGFALNGERVFLRGTVEYTGFPKTGHTPMEEGEWEHIFSLSKSYGINHYRFHSYCPPEAAFRTADRLGLTLQVELPIWAEKPGYGEQEELVEFMKREGELILTNYANHPSFTMLCLGNEYKSNFDVLDSVIRHFRKICPDKLYTFTSNYVRDQPTPESDYFVSDHSPAERMRINCWTKDGRFQAYMDGTDYDYSASVAQVSTPIIAHELGQWSSFPDYSYLDCYQKDSVFQPDNERLLAARLKKSRMMWQNKDFHRVTGRFSWLLYKEEIETCLRTPGFGGFQLLSLADSPGFGEAFTGAVNPWWQSKSFISPQEIRRFCAPVVPLLRFSKYAWLSNETFRARAVVANYSKQDLTDATLRWSITANGSPLAQGALEHITIPKGGPSELGAVEAPLDSLAGASRLDLKLWIDGTGYENSWTAWCYPAELETGLEGIHLVRTLKEAETLLKQGEDVLLLAGDEEFDLQETRFLSVFWSLWWFWRWPQMQPGNLSILCDPAHPALQCFPTDEHTGWQWWELLDSSRAFRITGVPEGWRPVVQLVDDMHRNNRLGTVVEACVEGGRLLACTHDLLSDPQGRPAARQLLYSLVQYMKSDAFKPSLGSDLPALKQMLGFRQ